MHADAQKTMGGPDLPLEADLIATQHLAYAKERLAHYEAKPLYRRKDGKTFGWGAEIAFWRGDVERLSAAVNNPHATP